MTKVVSITKPIIAQSVFAKPEASKAAAVAPVETSQSLPDIDPRRVEFPERPLGTWESLSHKAKFHTKDYDQGKSFFIVIGFAPVCGRVNGKEICINRPMEFFIPSTEKSGLQSWISATMRLLSRSARKGDVVEALQEMMRIEGDGPIFYGSDDSGKGRIHESSPAAIAWIMLRELQKAGYIDKRFNERPLEDLERLYKLQHQLQQMRQGLEVADQEPLQVPLFVPAKKEEQSVDSQMVVGTCPVKGCGGQLVLRDSCPTCKECSYSKCG
ncbi:MAG: hypothetical protein E6Q76_07395 [Rhizobium sp.]|nr:MAG: hypothetical protein E6Q76_07395 [Rhizobium sp.]